MHDKALVLAGQANVTTAQCFDARLAPGIEAWVWASDTLPSLEGIHRGTEIMSLIITPLADFSSGGTSLISWKLISTATTDVGAELFAGTYHTHWASGQLSPASYLTGRTVYVIPMTPRQEYSQYITLVGLFTDDGLDVGRIDARFSRAETMRQFPPANAI